MRVCRALASTLILAFVAPAFAGDNEPVTPATPPPTPAATNTITFVSARVIVWYDGSVKDPEKLQWQKCCMGWVKYKAFEAGIPYEEYNINNDKSDKKGEPSDKEFFARTVPKSNTYVDNLAEGQILGQRIRVAANNKNGKVSGPELFSGSCDPQEQAEFLLKPIMAFAKAPKPSVAKVASAGEPR